MVLHDYLAGLSTYELLTNNDQILILCLSHFINMYYCNFNNSDIHSYRTDSDIQISSDSKNFKCILNKRDSSVELWKFYQNLCRGKTEKYDKKSSTNLQTLTFKISNGNVNQG